MADMWKLPVHFLTRKDSQNHYQQMVNTGHQFSAPNGTSAAAMPQSHQGFIRIQPRTRAAREVEVAAGPCRWRRPFLAIKKPLPIRLAQTRTTCGAAFSGAKDFSVNP
jgi:hypothetical protein